METIDLKKTIHIVNQIFIHHQKHTDLLSGSAFQNIINANSSASSVRRGEI